MLKNITISADELVIRKAIEKANKERKKLDALFREWLNKYINHTNVENEYEQFMKRIRYVTPGRKFTREELNDR